MSDPRIAALAPVRKLAEETARELYIAEAGLAMDWDHWIDGDARKRRETAQGDLLSDLSRPASRDALVRLIEAAADEMSNLIAAGHLRLATLNHREDPEALAELAIRVLGGSNV